MAGPSPAPPSPRYRKKKQRQFFGFLAICLVFVALAYYHGSHTTYGSRKEDSTRMASASANSVDQFYSEYNKLPLLITPTLSGHDMDTDTSATNSLITVLMGKEEGITLQNPYKIDFLEEIKSARKNIRKDGTTFWTNGYYTDEITGSHGVVDAWGTPYKIRLDTNNDKQLANPNPDQVKEGRSTLSKRVLVWSAGKDGDWDTWDDNPYSWD